MSERDICTKYITPAIKKAGWDIQLQVREEVSLTKGRVIVRGKVHTRGKNKRADYILYYKPNIPIAVIEAKDNKHSVSDGMQQALGYAEMIKVPFVFSSNGDAFLFHNNLAEDGDIEKEISLSSFPSPETLWRQYCNANEITPGQNNIITHDYYSDGSGKTPRYYQVNAINRAIEAIAKGRRRMLLVMATGTGKTYTAFQIIWRLWKSGTSKRILFLADRNILVDQTKTNDFKPFGTVMTKIKKRQIDKSYEIYLSLYQAVTGSDEEKNIYKQFSRDFFDLIVIDECHRGSAADDSNWKEILKYFSSASHIGLTATPKETKDVSNIDYFGPPIYTYSLKQGIEFGLLLGVIYKKGVHRFFRARINNEEKPFKLKDLKKPPAIKVLNGRANPLGIPYLYVASTTDTAIAEVRGHKGEFVTVLEFNNKRDLELFDLRDPRNTISPFELPDLIEFIYKHMPYLVLLGDELSKPIIPRKANLEYLSSQYFCEVIKQIGFHGIIYKSSISNGNNYVIFSDNRLGTGAMHHYKITEMSFKSELVIPQ